jgi:hypothetical protein
VLGRSSSRLRLRLRLSVRVRGAHALIAGVRDGSTPGLGPGSSKRRLATARPRNAGADGGGGGGGVLVPRNNLPSKRPAGGRRGVASLTSLFGIGLDGKVRPVRVDDCHHAVGAVLAVVLRAVNRDGRRVGDGYAEDVVLRT